MTWQDVAYKDFQDAVRSRTIIILTVVFALFVAGATLAFSEFAGSESTLGSLLWALQAPSSLLIPVIAILISYRSIAGERELGSMRFLLALPHTRWDVLLGKILGRTLVVWLSVLIGFALAGVVAFRYYEFSPLVYFGFTVLTMLLGMVYVSIGVCVSAVTGSVSRAASLVLGVFIVLQYLWGYLWLLGLYIVNGFSLPDLDAFPAWFDFVVGLSPGTAYGELMISVINRQPGSDWVFVGQFDESAIQLPEWFPLLVLFGWIGLAVAVGYWRFQGAELV